MDLVNFKIATINMFIDLKETLNIKRIQMYYINKRIT